MKPTVLVMKYHNIYKNSNIAGFSIGLSFWILFLPNREIAKKFKYLAKLQGVLYAIKIFIMKYTFTKNLLATSKIVVHYELIFP